MIERLLRRLPPFMGKQRIARFLLKREIDHLSDVVINARHQCQFKIPNVLEIIGFELYINGSYEEDLVQFIVHQLKSNDLFLDIGANIGAITIPVCKQLRDVTPICVEAAPWIFDYLQFNITQNEIKKARLYNRAVSDRNGEEVKFYSPRDVFGKGSMASVFTEESVIVSTVTIDEIASKLTISENIGIIKIDIEGFEYYAFLGGKHFLTQDNSPDIIFEFVEWAENLSPGIKAGAAQELLFEYGYRIFIFCKGGVGDQIFEPLLIGSTMLFATKKR